MILRISSWNYNCSSPASALGKTLGKVDISSGLLNKSLRLRMVVGSVAALPPAIQLDAEAPSDQSSSRAMPSTLAVFTSVI